MLSGPVGAGKTTVARELATSSPGPAVNIEGDKFWLFIVKDAAAFEPSRNFKTIMATMTAAAGYEVILAFSIPRHGFSTPPAGWQKFARSLSISWSSGGAKASALREQPLGPEAQSPTILPIAISTRAFDAPPCHVVADDTSDVPAVAARVPRGLNKGVFRLAP